jgi:hypothetical protein
MCVYAYIYIYIYVLLTHSQQPKIHCTSKLKLGQNIPKTKMSPTLGHHQHAKGPRSFLGKKLGLTDGLVESLPLFGLDFGKGAIARATNRWDRAIRERAYIQVRSPRCERSQRAAIIVSG